VWRKQDKNNKLGTVDNFIDKFGKKHKIIFVVAMINVNSTASGREDFLEEASGVFGRKTVGDGHWEIDGNENNKMD
jgi:hypothetical protein